MSSCHTILSHALGDRFRTVANPISLGFDMHRTLSRLAYVANRSFEEAGNIYALDLEETPSHDQKAFAFFLTLYSCSTLDKAAQKKLSIDLVEPSLRLQYNPNGMAELVTTRNPIISDGDKGPHKTARSLTVKSTDQLAIQGFVASWLRVNLPARTMVDIATELERLDEKEANRWADTVVGRLEKVRKAR